MFSRNIGSIDRILRIVVGTALVATFFSAAWHRPALALPDRRRAIGDRIAWQLPSLLDLWHFHLWSTAQITSNHSQGLPRTLKTRPKGGPQKARFISFCQPTALLDSGPCGLPRPWPTVRAYQRPQFCHHHRPPQGQYQSDDLRF